MKFKNYLKELSVSKGTKVSYKKGRDYFNAEIRLEDGTIWYFNADNVGVDSWGIVFYNPDFDAQTKEKIGMRTFSAIEQVTREFIKQKNPKEFFFSGAGYSRSKLYDHFANKIKKGGYTLKKDNKLGGVEWRFTKE